ESDYIFYLHVLGRFDPARIAKLAAYVRCGQLGDGGWNIFAGGPSELNATVKAYFALKLSGDAADSGHMVQAARRVRELGGLERTVGLAAIYPAMMNSIFALIALGYAPDHPVTARQIDELRRFEIDESNTIRLQPCLSPLWDTAIAAFALAESGCPCDDVLNRA